MRKDKLLMKISDYLKAPRIILPPNKIVPCDKRYKRTKEKKVNY